ncbi:hypothetical protein Tco_0932565 [Tanacetum coccineum]
MQELQLQLSKDLQTLGNTSNQLKQEEQDSSQYWKPPVYYSDDFYREKDEHLYTILEMDSDEEIESSVENLNLTPSESEDLSDYVSECDLPFCDNSPDFNNDSEIFSNPLLDSNADYTTGDDKSSSDEDEFVGELAFISPIPPGIAETNFDPKEDIHLIKKLLYDNSSPRPPKELNSKISDAMIESFSSSPIPVKDSDSLMEEIDIFLAEDDSIPPGIDCDGYDSEEDNLFLEYEPDPGELTRVVVEDIFGKPRVHMPNPFDPLSPVLETLLPFSSEIEDKVFNPEILVSKEEKSPHLLSHRGFNAFKIIYNFLYESSMMIYGGDMPILDVPYLHFYPP